MARPGIPTDRGAHVLREWLPWSPASDGWPGSLVAGAKRTDRPSIWRCSPDEYLKDEERKSTAGTRNRAVTSLLKSIPSTWCRQITGGAFFGLRKGILMSKDLFTPLHITTVKVQWNGLPSFFTKRSACRSKSFPRGANASCEPSPRRPTPIPNSLADASPLPRWNSSIRN